MAQRKPDTVLTWPVARQLGVIADVDPRAIMVAAKGEKRRGDVARRAREAVADYFDTNPGTAPPGWTRPDEMPLTNAVARELAAAAGVHYSTIHRAAAGLPLHRDVAVQARAAVAAYFDAHPEARPAAAPSEAEEGAAAPEVP